LMVSQKVEKDKKSPRNLLKSHGQNLRKALFLDLLRDCHGP
jgi:hypothetical protein